MTYSDFDIKVMITMGGKASLALNSKDELIVIQQQTDNSFACVNLGKLTAKRAQFINEEIVRLSQLTG